MGTRRLFELAHKNPGIRIESSDHVHDARVLAQLDRLVAVNSALEVDLTGQANSEVAGGRYVGSVGGQFDFVRGAGASSGGVSIIALRAGDESRSRIVPSVASGVITTPRSDAGYIVTEYGIADLRGCTLSERARRMIAIASPEAREELARAAHDIR